MCSNRMYPREHEVSNGRDGIVPQRRTRSLPSRSMLADPSYDQTQHSADGRGHPQPTPEEHSMTQTIPTAEARRVMLTVAEAADELAVTERFIRKLISNGQLRAVKVGARVVRIRRTDLEDLLRPARVVPQLGRR